MSSQEFQEHHLSGSVLPPEFTEDLIKCFPEDGGLSYEEIRIQQESLYLAFQKKGNTRSGETSQSNSLPGSVRSSSGVDVASQLALDEALARSLQIDDGFDDIYTLAAESPPPREPPPPPCPPPHRPPPPPSAPARVVLHDLFQCGISTSQLHRLVGYCFFHLFADWDLGDSQT
ncbi:unnamed protein product [Cuscuta campestris]|uniref:Uncharacterized protein n=1 Tax=Cuscuta campestris TaxID=132261 RepID=A0A484L8W0_9ASTE|nr:unnamed protein product [Cuscuta campestris]